MLCASLKLESVAAADSQKSRFESHVLQSKQTSHTTDRNLLGDVIAGACVLLGSAASSPYWRPDVASKETTDLQLMALMDYFCNASINYDLLPSIRNRVLFFAGMQVCSTAAFISCPQYA
jgi:hypothetical protein